MPAASAPSFQEVWAGAAKPKRVGMIPDEDVRAAPGGSPSPADPHNAATSPETPDGLAAGLIISADMFVGNTDSDRHTLTVRPADGRREFTVKVVGMADEGPVTPGEPMIGPDTALAVALAPLSVPRPGGPSGIDWRLPAKIRA
ncbi:hypothetical protein ebA6960 [Aromatoleum aromaticum EbN1]|uniref:Uncharacterized protein n=3 Tax=Aromatoleum aromaticum TaxID=551760 RepID=Q5NXX5_AROAE|nr:hypothetical protein ebA6960 [Aromatoleum aromaticum EbN1]